MHSGIPRPCKRLGCPYTTVASHGLCAGHRREEDAARGSPAARGYDASWLVTRARILKRDPICTEDDCEEPSTDVDHIVPKRQGGTDDDSNLRGLCHPHHSRKTVAHDGGFGR